MATGGNGVYFVEAGSDGNKKFGALLSDAMLANKTTPKKLADEIGVHASFIRGIVRGVQAPSLETANKMLMTLRVETTLEAGEAATYDLAAKNPLLQVWIKFYFKAQIKGQNNRGRVEESPKLAGKDYMNLPAIELMQHPDYSPHAMRVIMAISKMTTKQLEQLTIARGPING